jgi:hypothetical protein
LSGVNHQRPNLVLPDSVYTGNDGPSAQYLNPAAFAAQPFDPKPKNCTKWNWSYLRQLRSSNNQRGGQRAKEGTHRGTDHRRFEAV